MRFLNRLSFINRPRVWLPLMVVVLLVIAVVMAFRNLNGPAEGTITSQAGAQTRQIQNQPAIKNYSDKYLSFSYPSKFQITPVSNSPAYLDNLDLSKTQRRDEYGSITLARGTLGNSSGVSYRRQHPELYKTVEAATNIVVFSKSDGLEYTGFIAHNGMVVSISLTAVLAQNLSADYYTIANSLQWTQ